ncbi:helix-turn-helix transcriptional regulator [Solidesulfovibrio magneticus]|uniref:AraC family transcriptional regulator n=1 Tax=Solidesulfovibrio magneticus (strain ATCC 700980 / DSM 13731 / RS-1) TaxID=573370 RepID=C4XLQ4_SOLM1|nr:AraC family transcriptional regulator [Solidesulfovibrio magneticus]BAH74642.1 AraC family transcriptional regulator [Solidesulfovibrio magneticus RS-1]
MSQTSRLDVLRHPGLPGLSVVQGRDVAADIAPHAHGAVVVGLILDGGRELSCGGGRARIEAGEGFIVPDGVRHSCAPLARRGQSYVAVAVAPQLLAEVGRADDAPEDWVRPWRNAEASAWLLKLAEALAEDADAALEALCALAHGLRLRPGPGRPSHPAVAVARAAIEADPAAPHDLASLAALAGVGPTYLQRLFVRETGMAVGQYLLARRVAHGAGQAAAGEGLAQAALSAGFCDQSHFTRQCKRRLGVPPGAYREWNGGEGRDEGRREKEEDALRRLGA